MILYHTSTLAIPRPDTLHSRQHLDFGQGFYLTALKEQALRYGERFLRRNEPAVMNVYEFDETLDQLQYKKPNHQVCITSQQLIERHLHYIDSETIIGTRN